MDTFEKEQVKKMNATLKEISKAIARLGNEIVKLRDTIERNGYAVLPTIEMTAEERKKMFSEIYILKKCLTDRDRAIKVGFIISEAQRKQIEEQQKGISDIKRLKLLLDEKRKEKEDLSYGHVFKFGDKVFVPWSCDPYVYIKPGWLYNPRTESLVYVGKTQHLKWFGERFEIK